MYDAARKAAIKDQEVAGIDIVSDGELQRDNMIDYFAERMPGVQVDHGSKRFYYDFYESVVRSKLATGSLGLSDEVRFLATVHASAPAKISISGPHTLVKRIRNEYYPSEEAFALDLGAGDELRAARAGARRRHRTCRSTSRTTRASPRICRGRSRRSTRWSTASTPTSRCTSATATATASRRSRAATGICSRQSSTPRCRRVSLEFARRGEDDLQLFKEFKVPFTLGLGVIDVKTHDVESPGLVADRIRRALDVIPAERLVINPDCGWCTCRATSPSTS